MSRARDAPPRRVTTRVVRTAALGGGAHALILERCGMHFAAGQLVTLHGRDVTEDRDYSIASGTDDPHLEILYRAVPNGRLTSRLVRLSAGDEIEMTGPYGRFTLRDPAHPTAFIATGTGIAPCRAYARSHTGLDLTVVHGAPHFEALHYAGEMRAFSYRPCLSRETRPDCFAGRVTDYVRGNFFAPDSHYYLCGAFEMISEVSEVLEDRGISPECIFTETYYYAAGR